MRLLAANCFQETQGIELEVAAVRMLLNCDSNPPRPTPDFGGGANADRTELRGDLAGQTRFRKIAQEGRRARIELRRFQRN